MPDIDPMCWNRQCLFFDQEHSGNCMPCIDGEEANVFMECNQQIQIDPNDTLHNLKCRQSIGKYLRSIKKAKSFPMFKKK